MIESTLSAGSIYMWFIWGKTCYALYKVCSMSFIYTNGINDFDERNLKIINVEDISTLVLLEGCYGNKNIQKRIQIVNHGIYIV